MPPRFQSADDICQFIVGEPWRRAVLQTVQSLALPDWAVGAGFIRNAVWDALHDRAAATPLADVDVLYFDPANLNPERDKVFETELSTLMPDVPWSVKNQARMHLRNRDQPYLNTLDALRHWLETPTAVAIRLVGSTETELLAPYGIADLVAMIVRPTPSGLARANQYAGRVQAKRFTERWPLSRVEWPTQP
jgi:hypothetical protein